MRGTRDRRPLAGAVLTLVLLVLACACAGQQIPGRPSPSRDIDPVKVAGLPITSGPSGLKPGVPPATLTVRNYAGTDMDVLAVDAVSDISAFWVTALPQDFGRQFTPVKALTSFDANGANTQVCRQNSQGVQNAFYCPADDSVSWDRGTLLPVLDKMFGQMAVVTVFAHEMGHAVQYRLGSVNEATPTIVKEQQADCYAGAFIRWVAAGNAPHFQISTGDGLNQVLATMMFIRDQVGTTAVDPQAHGSAFDRVTAFQFGFQSGPVRCDKIDLPEIRQRITELGFPEAVQGDNNVPVDGTTIGLLEQSLNAAFKRNAAKPPQLVNNGARCARGGSTPPASYCPQDNTIGFDQDALNRLAALPPNDVLGVSGTGLGDFAAFAEVASRYVLSVQRALGIPLDDKNAGLRTACLTGAWAGVIRHRFTDGPRQQLLLGPGDLDEAVAELLSPTSLIAADVNGSRVPAGFARVSSFQVGFLQGSKVCTTQFG
ncbi:MAG TPA: neutral zinc metallopeptidase [Pseudonocardiaceae bacterium]|nr:neutral zinc metallopeptidase [Pseudonocardiaceae bacterium]